MLEIDPKQQLFPEIITMMDGQPMPDAEVIVYQKFFNALESDQLFQELLNGINWQQDKVKFNEQEIGIPRLTAWYGDEGKSYSYSGMVKHPSTWNPTLLRIRSRVEKVEKVNFNSVLLNLYRSGKDRVSWHSDDEAELGKNPIIASVSFGETRRFQFRHRINKTLDRITVNLTHGSLLIMKGSTQHFWQHQIPEAAKSLKERINLTFRIII
ncbi:alkylated DNA repair protein [Cylindrospermum stagnale PCC 7417]|uniref:Alkylated DNA repair protein n=1 Tax=Cylindrospermum stagnale PCC 7417 TaxID=56107 RepID=K9X230_9NOST|nr:alpha-ketoglutarate-dependent dioxygenase AlkB [Cylindrospermum stagnale]AFZ26695.1 alkylated DNA repair protein [Cylindrospermum stagnale PCC 7417]